jgi:glycogen debranching enzyme
VTGSRPGLQPLLHELLVCLAAPTSVLSDFAGQIRGSGVQGVLQSDRRTLSEAVLTVAGLEPEPLTGALEGTSGAAFIGLTRSLGDPGPDPTVRVERHRVARPDGMIETVAIVSTASTSVRAEVAIRLASDGAYIEDIKVGKDVEPAKAPVVVEAARFTWSHLGIEVFVEGVGARASFDGEATLAWTVEIEPRGTAVLSWSVSGRVTGAVTVAPTRALVATRPEIVADDVRMSAWLARSLDDIAALSASTSDVAGEAFVAAGAPWYLALFGRDSLWSARMLLPAGTAAAESTLAVLAHFQGQHDDSLTSEEPGKILHELRAARHDGHPIDGWQLPPRYYGTIDATMLWVVLFHDAWRWGMPTDRVERLLDSCVAALDWIAGPADADGDGFLAYEDVSGTGLSNQGWKDSRDSVRFRDGRIAQAPIALCEVQGYAYEALRHGADVLEAFGRSGADRYRARAAVIGARFREAFWVEDAQGAYPAMALDGDKRPVDALTSNIGHLLGTGLLDASESSLVAQRLLGRDMDSGYGLRTMSSSDGGYSPLSYHCGSVWPHDTTVAVMGLSRSGLGSMAGPLVRGLLRAAASFDHRLPELYGGDAASDVSRPVPYPASCHPQAWAAASAVASLGAILGLAPDVPAGRLRLSPMQPSPIGAISVAGLSVGGGSLAVEVDRAGGILDVTAPPGLVVDVA